MISWGGGAEIKVSNLEATHYANREEICSDLRGRTELISFGEGALFPARMIR